MDDYTKETRHWLERRFKETDEKGIYKSHAPIYGFSKGHIFLGLYKNNFAIFKEIENLTSRYSFGNFLEVGCAEGFTSHLVESIFGFQSFVLDISFEAVKRAGEIYQLKGIVADAQNLECIKSESFDLVLCSETLEHLPDPEKAIRDLLRISKKALIITVPAARNRQEKEGFIPSDKPHTHLHIFDKDDFKNEAFSYRTRGVSLKWLDNIESLFTGDGKTLSSRNQRYLENFYRLARFLFLPLRKFYGVNLAKLFIKLDYCLACAGFFDAITYMAVYLKGKPEFNKKIKPRDILNFMLKDDRVNYHFLNS